jgi:RNA polymerase sigma factor (sigma-70 family)
MQTPREAERERQLFEAFVAGDDGAFEQLFRRYRPRLVRDARRYVPAELAEDLVQHVFTELWMQRARWTIHTTVRTYLHSAVRNGARDLLARVKTEQRAADAFRAMAEAQQPRGPEELLLFDELEQAVAHGLETCSPRCRAALLLLLLDDGPRYAEIAHRLGNRPGTAHVLLKRARRRLRASLRAQGWDDLVKARPPLSEGRARPHRAGPSAETGIPRGRPTLGLETDFDLAG